MSEFDPKKREAFKIFAKAGASVLLTEGILSWGIAVQKAAESFITKDKVFITVFTEEASKALTIKDDPGSSKDEIMDADNIIADDLREQRRLKYQEESKNNEIIAKLLVWGGIFNFFGAGLLSKLLEPPQPDLKR